MQFLPKITVFKRKLNSCPYAAFTVSSSCKDSLNLSQNRVYLAEADLA